MGICPFWGFCLEHSCLPPGTWPIAQLVAKMSLPQQVIYDHLHPLAWARCPPLGPSTSPSQQPSPFTRLLILCPLLDSWPRG